MFRWILSEIDQFIDEMSNLKCEIISSLKYSVPVQAFDYRYYCLKLPNDKFNCTVKTLLLFFSVIKYQRFPSYIPHYKNFNLPMTILLFLYRNVQYFTYTVHSNSWTGGRVIISFYDIFQCIISHSIRVTFKPNFSPVSTVYTLVFLWWRALIFVTPFPENTS